MTDDDRLRSIERKLDDYGDTLKEMAETLSKLAVQENRLNTLETQQQTLWRKYDALVDPSTGQLSIMARWQASCPRNQIKFLWWFVASVNLGLLITVLAVVAK